MRRLLQPPTLPGEAETQRARIFHRVTWLMMAIASFVLVLVALTQPVVSARAGAALLTVDLTCLGLLALNRRGHTALATKLLVGSLLLLVTIMALNAGGVRSPGVGMYVVFVLMAGLLLGHQGGVATAIVCGALGLGLVGLEAAGRLPAQLADYTPLSRWLLTCLYMGLVVVLLRLATSAVEGALARARTELDERTRAESRLRRAHDDLRARVEQLRLLHATARVLQRDRPLDASVLEDLVLLLPQAWTHADGCEARISYRDLTAQTPGWRGSPWIQSEPFACSGGTGVLEVACLAERPASAGDPFSPEERALLRSVAEMLVAFLEHHHAEERRRSLETQLRHSQKMEALGTLAGGVAHDFNNILTAIGLNAELALEDPSRTDMARDCLRAVCEAHRRARDLVKRILLFSRKHEPRRQVIALAPVVAETVKLLRSSLPAMIEIVSTEPGDLPPVFADGSQIHQVLMNLGTNAGHAMAERGGVLSIALARVAIDDVDLPASHVQPGSYVCITVRDTGTGMSPEIMERLFEPFFTTKGHGGTGLGLAVVHGIVRDHQGGITVDSELGQGSTFRIYLPMASSASAAREDDDSRPRGNGQHVMYVDDEEALVFAATRSLERLGYRCTAFSDADAALQAFRMSPTAFDAVVCDLSMPKITGLQLLREMQAIRPDIRVALTSGYHESAPAVQLAAVAVRIPKPPTLAELARALERLFHLEQRHS